MNTKQPKFVTPKQIIQQHLLPWRSFTTLQRKALTFKVTNYGCTKRPVYDLNEFYWQIQRHNQTH